jgi:hypothetical protein
LTQHFKPGSRNLSYFIGFSFYLLRFPKNPETKNTKSSGNYFYNHVDMTNQMLNITLLKNVHPL